MKKNRIRLWMKLLQQRKNNKKIAATLRSRFIFNHITEHIFLRGDEMELKWGNEPWLRFRCAADKDPYYGPLWSIMSGKEGFYLHLSLANENIDDLTDADIMAVIKSIIDYDERKRRSKKNVYS